MKRQLVFRYNLDDFPAPTVPPVSWAEAKGKYDRGPRVGDPDQAADYFRKFIGGKPNEAFLCMYQDHQQHILDVVLEGEGTVDSSAIFPREVFKRAISLSATGLILAHNHPAGGLEPSEADKALTRQMVLAANALGLKVHDHLIVTHEGFFSFHRAGFIR